MSVKCHLYDRDGYLRTETFDTAPPVIKVMQVKKLEIKFTPEQEIPVEDQLPEPIELIPYHYTRENRYGKVIEVCYHTGHYLRG